MLIMSNCILCYEDFNHDNRCHIVINSNNHCVVRPSEICYDCLLMLKQSIIKNLLTTIANETCEASLKRIMKADLPTHLSIDGTGRGQQIDKIIKNDKTISAELESDLSKDEIVILNSKIKHIRDLITNDDDLFLLEINLTFKKYK